MYNASVKVATFEVLAEFRQNSIPHVRQRCMYYWSQRLQCIQYMHATAMTRQRMPSYDLHMHRMTTHLHLQPQYLHNLISVQPCHNKRSLSMLILTRPPTRSSLKINNSSFQYAAPYFWNQLPTVLHEPRQILSPSRSPPITHGSSSSLSPLSSSLTHSFILSF